MLERISELLHLAYRQEWAIRKGLDALSAALRPGTGGIRAFLAAVLLVIQSLNFALFEVPMPATGQELDLSGYQLVFCDEFEGDSLNTDVWKYRYEGARRDGFDSRSQIKVADGCMTITAEYLTDGAFGEGWYTGNVSLLKHYNKGYFEIRCKCNDGGDFWSAFWIQGNSPYDHEKSDGGRNSAEIDIFEAFNATKKGSIMRNAVTTTIHCNGWDDDPEHIDSRNLGTFRGNNIYDEFNTYGLEWNDDEYIFYINGVETVRSSFGKGVSQEEEEVIVSLESPNEITLDKDFSSQYVIDYVKIYQVEG